MSQSDSTPRVSIVTPSFNQARFLRHSIDSVLAQSYKHIDYLVVDACSTDGSVEILRSYGDRLRWISEPDAGQSDAIAKGFARTTGDILTWINSDDALLPGAVETAVDAFRANPDAALIYGHATVLDEAGQDLGVFAWTEPVNLWRLVFASDYIVQPSAFFRRSAYDGVGGLDRTLHYGMDWDLWIRLAAAGEIVFLPDKTLGCSRVWTDAKTSTGGWRRIRELGRMSRRHTGRAWTPAVKRYALETLVAKLGRLPRPLLTIVEALRAQVDRRILNGMAMHLQGWVGPRGELVFPRRWGRAELELEIPEIRSVRGARVDVAVEGGEAQTRRLTSPGRIRFELAVPPSSTAPFCSVGIRSDFVFREPGTGRPHSVRLIRLARLAGGEKP